MIIHEPNKGKVQARVAKPRRRIPRPKINFPLKISVLVFLALAVTAGAGLAVYSQLTGAGSVNDERAPSNVQLTEFTEVYLSTADEQTKNAASASLVAPKSWKRARSQFSPTDLIDSRGYGVLNVTFTSGETGPSAKKQGRIVVENISSWLESDETKSVTPIGGLVGKSAKQNFFSALNATRQSKSVGQLDWTKVFKEKSEIGGVQSPQYVNSADGKLGGIVYATIVSTDNSYRPHIVAYLAGSVAGEPILLRAQFAVENQTFRELYGSISSSPEAAQQAINEYKKSSLDKDDTAMLGHVAAVLKSMTLDTAGR